MVARFFFFKQKTAYEMRISDWSSDVCSSDLVIEHFIEAEHADFHWDGRLAEMNLGAWESLDEEDGAFERVAIIGYFRSRYYVATCIVDGARHVHWMLHLRHFESFESAEKAFLAVGG